jgi:hypothetical protein
MIVLGRKYFRELLEVIWKFGEILNKMVLGFGRYNSDYLIIYYLLVISY